MRQIRIYSPAPLAAHSVAELGPEAARHVSQVLRMQADQALTVFDGTGGEFTAIIEACTRSSLRVAVGEHRPDARESQLDICLWHGLCRSEKMDSVVQKATELGVNAMRPVLTERSISRLSEARAGKKVAHWQKIAISACEQSGRNRIPTILQPVSFQAALASDERDGPVFMLDPRGRRSLAAAVEKPRAATLFTGPEGGFSAAEVAAAEDAGLEIVRLGPRILRTETAPVVGLTVLQLLAGDLDDGSR